MVMGGAFQMHACHGEVTSGCQLSSHARTRIMAHTQIARTPYQKITSACLSLHGPGFLGSTAKPCVDHLPRSFHV